MVHPHAPHGRPSWASSDDQTLFNLIVIGIGAVLFFYLLWTSYHGAISAAVLSLRHDEMAVLGHVTDRFVLADRQVLSADPERVTLRDLYGISDAIGAYWRLPACVLLLALAALCAVRAAPSRYKRRLDLERLAHEQRGAFKATAAFLDRGLRLTALASVAPRPADYALTAEEWIDRFAADGRGGIDDLRARSALVQQLGPRWAGPEGAGPTAVLLFVTFALHLAQRQEAALELLGAASVALAGYRKQPEGPAQPCPLPAGPVAFARGHLADQPLMAPAKQVAAGHAFTTAALMSLLNAARLRAGVLPPAQFAWLKLVDRPLWYALQSLGFETEGIGRYLHPNARVEAIAARDHWAAERAAGRPLREPDIDRAMTAVRRAARSRARAARISRHGRPAASPQNGKS